MKCFVAFFLLLFSTLTVAGIYECKDKNGNVSYQDHSCEKGKNGAQINNPAINSAQVDSKENWTLINQTDQMTNKKQCVIESPSAYVGKQGSDFLFVSIRITATDSGEFVVGLYSSSPLSDDQRPPSFHNNIRGLGIKIDNNDFTEVDLPISSRVIGFNLEKSKQLISQMENGSNASIRVRFWPYDETFDGHKIALWDISRAIHELKSCKNIAPN